MRSYLLTLRTRCSIFLAVYIFVKALGRSPFISAEQADLFSGKKEVDDYEATLTEEAPVGRWGRILRWLF